MMKSFTSIIQTLVLLILLQGCSSMPLSTMLKMSSFDETDFVNLKAEDIRVKVRNNTQENVLRNNVLRYQYRGPEGAIDESFSMELINENVETIEHWFTDNSVQHSGWYKLDSEGIKLFKELQKDPLLAMRKKEGDFTFSVTFKLSKNAPERFMMSIDLLLNPEDGYFTLFDQHELDLKEAQND
ncbi:hypothetical protein [Kangiella sp.]|uniref:hypothetical protein n=1 Tax=Kangiella sp. TaxID=1920245 RepID=UPI001997A1C4|nr:hypothetical protein [Kangiella sp.]MBD3653550.1 hypothetical protein [Kangiella sp.]